MLESSAPSRPVVAALMMLARELLPDWDGWPVTVSDILALVGTGKSQAYEVLDRLKASLPSLVGRVGRPVSPAVDDKTQETLFVAIRQYIVRHPGAVCGTGDRSTYSDGFRRFVVGLQAPGASGYGVTVERLAALTGVALGTLKDWLYPSTTDSRTLPEGTDTDSVIDSTADSVGLTINNVHVRLVVSLWPTWEGSFRAFCLMLRTEHRFPHGDTYIGSILHGHRLRYRKPHQPVEAPWSSGTFRALFPGAQWQGDGTELPIRWNQETFTFNVQPFVDVASNATVGVVVTATEDAEAVCRAYAAALETTAGVLPVAVTLDNKPSNHSPGVVAAMPGTILLRSTPGRGQAKAAVEGSFGLFQQTMPPLQISGDTPREMAQSALELIMTTWHRGRNGRPRKSLGGLSPAAFYHNKSDVTRAERAEAEAWFDTLHYRQDRYRLTREARLDPVRIELLTKGLVALHIDDPDGRLAKALAGYGRDAIVRGLAVLNAKQDLGTLSDVTDLGRYLGGIIRNVHTQLELERIAIHLLGLRVTLKDLTLRPLNRAVEHLRTQLPLSELPQAMVDCTLKAVWAVDAHFWQQEAVAALSALPAADRPALYHRLCLRIAASHTTPRDCRTDLLAALATAV